MNPVLVNDWFHIHTHTHTHTHTYHTHTYTQNTSEENLVRIYVILVPHRYRIQRLSDSNACSGTWFADKQKIKTI